MAISCWRGLHVGHIIRIHCRSISKLLADPYRYALKNEVVEEYRKSSLSKDQEEKSEVLELKDSEIDLRKYKHIYQEFLPHPNWMKRDRIKEMLERQDMYKRRRNLQVPEFYVGSILAVSVADQYAPDKTNRFVGLCISRQGNGLLANFTLRNVIDGQGVEIRYEIYQPHLHRIEVLKLEKRLDEELFYLRDALPEYSTIPFDMDPVPFPKGSKVPVNTVKVRLNPRPWLLRYERMALKGVEDLGLPQKFYDKAEKVAKPWEKYDLMKDYRVTINDTDAYQVYKEVVQHLPDLRKESKKQK